jgi:type II secretory pathway component GspD/PulD (secretin)
MKRIPTLILLAALAGLAVRAADPPPASPGPTPETAPATPPPAPAKPEKPSVMAALPEGAGTNHTAIPAVDVSTNGAMSVVNGETDTNCLRLNFRGAPLDLVLNYMSEAAGFIIVLDAQPRGKVDVWSSQPLTRDEAVELLNSVLNRNGLAAIRKGRTLTIVNKDEAKTKALPVKFGADPEIIPDSDEMVTQIIPVRYVEVGQLIKDIQPLVSSQTAMTANESGNSIVITDTQCNIRRVAEVIKAIDMGAEDMTVVKVFRLQFADPNEMSDLLVSLFPDETRSGGNQSPIQFGGMARMFGRGGAFGGGGAPGGGGGSNTQNQRIKKRARVVSVPDPRTSSVVVCAAKDLMEQIEQVVLELDNNPAKKQTVKVIPLEHTDPQQAMQVLQDIFNKTGTSSSRNQSQNSALQSRSQQQQQQYNNQTSRQGMNSQSRGSSFGR